MSRTSASTGAAVPATRVNSWYVIATNDEVSRQPLARRALGDAGRAVPHAGRAGGGAGGPLTPTGPTR